MWPDNFIKKKKKIPKVKIWFHGQTKGICDMFYSSEAAKDLPS